MNHSYKNALANILFFGVLVIFGISTSANAQQVSGRVTDGNGETLPAVNILVKGADIGVFTDSKGHYSMNLPSLSDTLVFSYVGYQTKEVAINGRTEINISLKSREYTGKEVVVIGYGEKQEKNLIESVSTIGTKELNLSPSINVGNMLAGKTTGLQITQRSGYPYSGSPDILIRGIGSLTKGRSRPLFIVDGVKRDIFHLGSDNIESISVLKDAAATAIYGVEGANGVILVKTKRGSEGPAKVSVKMSAGLQEPVRQPNFIDSYTYATSYNRALISDGTDPNDVRFPEKAIKAFRDHSHPIIYPNTDWVKYLTKPLSFQTKNSISVSGGTDKIKYFISGGYLKQDGFYKTFDIDFDDTPSYKKYNFRSNLDIDLTPTTRLSLTGYGRLGKHTDIANFGNEWENVYKGAPFAGAGLRRVPGTPAAYGDLVLVTANSATDSPYIPGDKHDPLKLYYGEGSNIHIRSTVNIDLNLRQKLDMITRGLSFQLKGSYNTVYQKAKLGDAGEPEYQAFFKTDVDPGAPGDSTIVYQKHYRSNPLTYDESYAKDRNWYMEARLNYTRDFGPHSISGLLLFNQRKNYYPSSYVGIPRGLVGLVGRINYSYDDRYLLEVNMGYNGSENFAKGRRFGFFPSVSGGWIVTNESFMKDVQFLDHLKLKASYGITGSDQGVGRFLYLPSTYYINGGYGYNFGYNVPQNAPAAAETSIGNPEVSWATAKKQNYGIDLRFLNNRLKMGFELFYQDRTNILTTLNTIPAYVSAPLPAVNLGEVKNHGYEVEIGWDDQIGNNFSYHIGGNVSFARNKIIEMDEVNRGEPYLQRTGNPVGQPFGYVFDRYYEEGDFTSDGSLKSKFPQPDYTPQAGDLKYIDLNADGALDANDQRAIGYPNNPEYAFGSTIGFDYKNFSVITIWQGSAHVSRMFGGSPFRTAYGLSGRGGYGTFQWQIDGAWTPEKGQSATYPRLTTTDVKRRNEMDSDFWIKDASYLRLKNAKIAYNLPSTIVSRLALRNVEVYLSGYNLLTFSKLKKYSLDPERTANSSDTVYPIMKVYNFGINIDF